MKYIYVVIYLIFTLFSHGNEVQKKAWKEIKKGALLVDVRSKKEFDAGHLKNAILIPYTKVKNNKEIFGNDKNRVIVVYCKVGGRAELAKQTLKSMGYKNIINAGGYKDMLKAENKN